MPDETEIAEEEEPGAKYQPGLELVSYPADFTLEVLYEKWKAGVFDIPDFQRLYVWTQSQASRLIDSFLTGIPVPPIFVLQERKTGHLTVVDGQQRLLSIAFFFKGVFPKGVFPDDRVFRLKDVLEKWEGKTDRKSVV